MLSDLDSFIVKKFKVRRELEGIDDKIIGRYVTSLRSKFPSEFKRAIKKFNELKLVGSQDLIEKNSDFKRIVKELRKIFHSNYYLFVRDYNKREKLLDEFNKSRDVNYLKSVALTHVSVRERVGSYQRLNEWIRSKLGCCDIVLDIGCGFNPIYINIDCEIYYGIDLNPEDLKVNEVYFDALNKQFLWQAVDVIKFPDPLFQETVFKQFESKLCLMFKVVDVFENIRKNSSLEFIKALINNLGFRDFVISFPTKSICGRKMKSQRKWFLNFLNKNTDYDFKLEKLETPNELFYYVHVVSVGDGIRTHGP